MESGKTEYKKFPFKKRKLVGASRLWIGPDHLLLVDSTGISETYRRFFYKDIQAVNLVKKNSNHYKMIALLLFTVLSGIAAVVSWKYYFPPGLVIFCIIGPVLAVYTVRQIIKGPACDCWVYSSVQKEKLLPVGTMKAGKRFIDFLLPRVEQVQGSLSPDSISAGQKRVTAAPAVGKQVTGNQSKQIADTWHKAAFSLLILVGGLSLVSIYYRQPVLTIGITVFFLVNCVICLIAVVRQAGSTLPGWIKITAVLSLILQVLWGIAGYFTIFFIMFQNVENMEYLSNNTWGMIKMLTQLDPFEYPVILAIDIFSIVSSFLLGFSGLAGIRKSGKNNAG
mgnify:CR=1 FL=1